MYSSKKLSMTLLPKVPGLQLENVACWVRLIPTPFFAAMLLQEHGETPVEERGKTTKRNQGQSPSR
jgi:hypothetical protein